MRHLPSSVCVVAACLLCAPVALPCSAEFATRSVRLPPAGAHIPTNLVRFRVLDEVHAHKISLRTVNGARVPTQLKDGILTTEGDPAPGEFVLNYPVKRRGGEVTLGQYAFTVIASAPLELGRATLTQLEYGMLHPDSARNKAAFVRLRYDSPDTNGNAAHLLEDAVTVDGRPYKFDFSASQAAGVPIIELKSLCNAYEGVQPGWERDTCGVLYSIPQGRHTITVKPHVLGEAAQPRPVSFAVTLSCSSKLTSGASPVATPGDGLDATATSHEPAALPLAMSEPGAPPRPPDTAAARTLTPSTTAVPTAAESTALPVSPANPTPAYPTSKGCALSGAARGSFAPPLLLGLWALWRRRHARATPRSGPAVTSPHARGAGTFCR